MENIDVFESVFKRALREPYKYDKIAFDAVLLVTDLEADALKGYAAKVRTYFEGLGRDISWTPLGAGDYARWADLQARIEKHKPALIVTYRQLQEEHEEKKFSLGAYLDTMAQAVKVPVLVLPFPDSEASDKALRNRDSVMVVTNHLNGEHKLVNYGVALTQKKGELYLCHLEDEDNFDYYMSAIEKIPEIDTGLAREKIRQQLLAAPKNYIRSVIKVLKDERPGLTVREHVNIGRLIDHYRELLQNHKVDILVFDAKDETQLAMHSLGYSLAVEFQNTPVLLI